MDRRDPCCINAEQFDGVAARSLGDCKQMVELPNRLQLFVVPATKLGLFDVVVRKAQRYQVV